MTKDEPLRADDFPIQTDEEKLKTREGRPAGSTESKEVAEKSPSGSTNTLTKKNRIAGRHSVREL